MPLYSLTHNRSKCRRTCPRSPSPASSPWRQARTSLPRPPVPRHVRVSRPHVPPCPCPPHALLPRVMSVSRPHVPRARLSVTPASLSRPVSRPHVPVTSLFLCPDLVSSSSRPCRVLCRVPVSSASRSRHFFVTSLSSPCHVLRRVPVTYSSRPRHVPVPVPVTSSRHLSAALSVASPSRPRLA